MSSSNKTDPLHLPREKTIGILGGGQLGRMLAMAAGRMGFFTIVFDPATSCPAAQFASSHIIADYEDQHALEALAKLCFVITYEFENIPVSSAKILQDMCAIYPEANALETSQDRLVEKNFIRAAGLSTTEFMPVSNRDELDIAIQSIGPSAILKTRRLGYDGKGQIRIDSDNPTGLTEKIEAQINAMLKTECILESMIDFDCEISIIGGRNTTGNTACFDPARNIHENGILVQSQVPCNIPDEITLMAKDQTEILMRNLDYVGVIGVEFFVTKSGNLLINEFAPRVHNSGHWTEAACLISQFEQHIRAITGQSLGLTYRHSDCLMQNLIGNSINDISKYANADNTLIHDYGKMEIRAGRKMGHITTITPRN
ncbi:MAG: 5-(carboxyamino)imidazole ribonucleotide synthase [Hyphomicrobiales bacterium]|nr:5-(carboxyamino)imidazole ribonucleotide synthase [Hyphomicrobiales bacterium]